MSTKCEKYIENVFYCCIIKEYYISKGVVFMKFPIALQLYSVRDDMEKAALDALEEKFNTIKNGKGIAYTVPMTSTIGVAIYQFLCNNPTK